ncbi:MAG: TIGR02266 family protein [Deltaproteobacteria bacterium]|nr:TIGR02266 family protein [Deltaproteobacteria bacterium]
MKANMTDDHEQRRSKRIEYNVEVGVSTDANFFTGFIQNISEGGLFVATHDPLDVGSELQVKFTLPTLDDEVSARAVVRWVRPYDERNPDAVPGMGVQFQEIIPEKATAAINDFIKQREPEFFED